MRAEPSPVTRGLAVPKGSVGCHQTHTLARVRRHSVFLLMFHVFQALIPKRDKKTH